VKHYPKTPFQRLPVVQRKAIVKKVSDRLRRAYGKPRLENPVDPLDDLVFIMLSNRTVASVAKRVYKQLKFEFGNWHDTARKSVHRLIDVLRPAGLARKRAAHLKALIMQIERDLGPGGLGALAKMKPREAEDYLTQLPGVSNKVAKCVMMYTLGFKVLPVDAHVHRIATRLGWTTRKRADQCHEELEGLVPPPRRYAFHVDCIVHGRLICRRKLPICNRCCINAFCEYFRRANEAK